MAIRSGTPFEWKRGLRLQATEEVHLIFPAGILIEGQPFKSVIEISNDDARIAVGEKDGKLGKVHVFLKAGDNVILRRNTEALFASEVQKETSFVVLAGG
jgi:hypothetical protein